MICAEDVLAFFYMYSYIQPIHPTAVPSLSWYHVVIVINAANARENDKNVERKKHIPSSQIIIKR